MHSLTTLYTPLVSQFLQSLHNQSHGIQQSYNESSSRQKKNKVLFAETGKEFVDFLFSLLSLPLGAIAGLLETNGLVGSFGSLYQSVKQLNQTYILPGKTKDSILKPNVYITQTPSLLPPKAESFMLLPKAESSSPKFYMCSTSCVYGSSPHLFVADNPNMQCPTCRNRMCVQAKHIGQVISEKQESDGRGFVKDVVTYMVTDNLEVTPMSTISCISLINKFNILDLSALEERVVDFGIHEGLKLLRASMHTKAVLTSVFMGKKAADGEHKSSLLR